MTPMDLQSFFVDGFSSHDLADALQELGFGDEVFEADATKSGLAGILAGLDMPVTEILNGFYPLALSNACTHFGVSGSNKDECITSLANLIGQPAHRS